MIGATFFSARTPELYEMSQDGERSNTAHQRHISYEIGQEP